MSDDRGDAPSAADEQQQQQQEEQPSEPPSPLRSSGSSGSSGRQPSGSQEDKWNTDDLLTRMAPKRRVRGVGCGVEVVRLL